MSDLTVKNFVSKDNYVRFDSYRAGFFYYNVMHVITMELYQFQIPVEDIGGATLLAIDKSFSFMRWIRKSISDGTLIKTK